MVAPISSSWSCGAATVRVAVGGLPVRCRPRCPQPGPMALVTVSRSPPASGYSTPVGPTVSLALLWSCPRSWLPAGPGGARPAHGQPPLKTGGVRRGTPRLRLEGLGGLEAPRNSDYGKTQSPERQPSLRRPYPLPAPDLGQTTAPHPPLPLCCPTWTWARLPHCLQWGVGWCGKSI